MKFLFVGRLSPVKGLHDVLNALPVEGAWTLDVLGDGPMREELEKLTEERGLCGKIFFTGILIRQIALWHTPHVSYSHHIRRGCLLPWHVQCR